MLHARGLYDCLKVGEVTDSRSWRIHHFIAEIRVLAKEISAILQHVPRCQNEMAGRVAKWSAYQMIFLGDHMLE